MKKILCALALSTVACASSAPTANHGVARLARELRTESVKDAPVAEKKTEKALPALSSPGDFVVVRFTGSYRKSPMTLSQRVLSREGTVARIELQLTEGSKVTQTLRAHIDQANNTDRVLEVVKVEGETEKPATIAAYDALMQKTMPDVDMNEDTLGTDEAEVALGGKNVAGKVTRYKVRIGGKDAVMSIFHADNFAWGDLAGDITAKDGKLIYKAEVVEVGKSDVATASR